MAETPAVSATLAKEFSQLLWKFLRSIGFLLIFMTVVGLSSGNEVCSLCKFAILSRTKFPILETHFSVNVFMTCFPIHLTALFHEFLLPIPTLTCRESSSLYLFFLLSLYHLTEPSPLCLYLIYHLWEKTFPIFYSSADLSPDFLIQTDHPILDMVT